MISTISDCTQEPGKCIPVINRNKCEGKEDCKEVCPYNVFTIGILPKEDRSILNFVGKIKGYAHGWKQAFVTNGDDCRACMLCVQKCPEKAITLVKSI
ncbi:MAG: ferredoxin family protein [Spirochaetia bacterium]|nr:ferredoxin family protein [Spirochaetia bacterium]